MSTGGIFTAILAGIVIGALGRLIIPGRQAIGWIPPSPSASSAPWWAVSSPKEWTSSPGG